MFGHALILVTVLMLAPTAAAADDPPPAPRIIAPSGASPRLLIEGAIGIARFVDDAPIHYSYFGGGTRFFFTRRAAVGPEFVYLNGDDAHQWHFAAALTVDLIPDERRDGRWPAIVPYIVAAGGYQRMTNRVGTGFFTSAEGSVSGGIGARVNLHDTFYVSGEIRLGWEPHVRYIAIVGARY